MKPFRWSAHKNERLKVVAQMKTAAGKQAVTHGRYALRVGPRPGDRQGIEHHALCHGDGLERQGVELRSGNVCPQRFR